MLLLVVILSFVKVNDGWQSPHTHRAEMKASYWKIRSCAKEKRNVYKFNINAESVKNAAKEYKGPENLSEAMIVRGSRRTHDGLGAQVLRNDQLLMLLQVSVVTKMKILCLPHQWDFNFAYGDVPAMSIFGCGLPQGPIGIFAGSDKSFDSDSFQRDQMSIVGGSRMVVSFSDTLNTTQEKAVNDFFYKKTLNHKFIFCLSSSGSLQVPNLDWVFLIQKVLRPQFLAVQKIRTSSQIQDTTQKNNTLKIAIHIRRGDTHPHTQNQSRHLEWGNHNISTPECKAVETDVYSSCLQAILLQLEQNPTNIQTIIVSTSGKNELGHAFNKTLQNDFIFTADLPPPPYNPNFPVNDHVASLARDLDFMVSADILIFSPRSEISRLAFALNSKNTVRAFAVRSRANECLQHNYGGAFFGGIPGSYLPIEPSSLHIPFSTLPHPLCYPLDLHALIGSF